MKKYSEPDSPNHLTEFAPLSSEVEQTHSFSWSKIFKWAKGSSPSPDNTSLASLDSTDAKQQNISKDDTRSETSDTSSNEYNSEQSKPTSSAGSDESQSLILKDSEVYTRSFSNVLRRISNILDRRLSTPHVFKDSDFKQYWMPDSDCKECYDCGDKFTTFRRRHHCRVCGQIFCSRCCNQEIPGKIIGLTGDLRVCTYCCKVVLSCLQSTDVSADSSSDLRSLREDLQNKLSLLDDQSDSNSKSYETSWRGPGRRKNSVGFREQGYGRSRTISTSEGSVYKDSKDFFSPEQSSSELKVLTQDSVQLRELWLQIHDPINGIQFHNHRHRLSTYPNCVVGSELVEWLIAEDKACSRHQASAICQALLDSKYLEPINSNERVFLDGYALYRPGTIGALVTSRAKGGRYEVPEHQEAQEPNWVQEIHQDTYGANCDTDEFEELESSHEHMRRLPSSSSMFYVTLDTEENRVSLNRNEVTNSIGQAVLQQAESQSNGDDNTCSDTLYRSEPSSQCPSADIVRTSINDDLLKGALEATANVFVSGGAKDDLSSPQNLQKDKTERLAFEKFSEAYDVHERALLNQLLSQYGLAQNWAEVVLPICRDVALFVKPGMKLDGGEMDIRQYVQIKKIPGGKKSESEIIKGVVSSKNIAHKKMRNRIINPLIFLVSSAIVYQRHENKLLSLEPAVLQERNYLKNIVAKISTFKPDIMLVQKTVSRLAQEYLLDLNITLIVNVKPSVMERVARLTQGDIASSIDAQSQLGKPQLGTCGSFRVVNYALPNGTSKTLIVFDGCQPHLGCTVILRGASAAELSKVKLITQFMIYACYNNQLERAFFMDESAIPPDEKHFVIGGDNNDVPEKTTQRDKTVRAGKRCQSHFVEDLSDPLRSYQHSEDDSIFKSEDSQLRVACIPRGNRFRMALDDTILNVTPGIKYTVPYLESESGRTCPLRKFFPVEVYWSDQFSEEGVKRNSFGSERVADGATFGNYGTVDIMSDGVEIVPDHQFVMVRLAYPVCNFRVQEILADFRAQGGRIKRLSSKELARRANENKRKDEEAAIATIGNNNQVWIDALDPMNHQRLSVLFCSYSSLSINAPNFCVNPWVVHMDFYGSNDISLGGFLEKYCFRSSYVCPSENCDVPMIHHVRRFVHGNACIHILLHNMEHPIKRYPDDIVTWSWCRKCKKVTDVTPLSGEAQSMSFAKYLELRFHNSNYTRRTSADGCCHSLHHDHYQYFANKHILTAFKYSLIVLRDIVLPPLEIQMTDSPPSPSIIIEDIKNFAVKGHGIYNTVLEHLFSLEEECAQTKYESDITQLLNQLQAEKNRFKERIEEIQINLTSPTVEGIKMDNGKMKDYVFTKDAETHLWKIHDRVVNLKRLIAETVASWNNRFQELVQQKKKDEKATKQTLGNIKTISAQTGSSVAVASESISPPKVAECAESCDTIIKLGTVDDTPDNSSSDKTGLVAEPDIVTSSSETPLAEINRSLQPAVHKINSEPLGLGTLCSMENEITADSENIPVNKMTDEIQASPDPVSDDTQIMKQDFRGHERSRSDGDGKLVLTSKLKFSAYSKIDDEFVDSVKSERKSGETIKNMISNLLSSTASLTLQPPFPLTEHHLLPHCERIPVIVFENEPSSIIAYALSSADYELYMQEIKEMKSSTATPSQSNKESRNSSPVMRRKASNRDSGTSIPANSESTSNTDSQPGSRKSSAFLLSAFRASDRVWPSRASPVHGFETVQYIAHGQEYGDQDLDEMDTPTYPTLGNSVISSDSAVEKDKIAKNANGKSPNHHIEVQFIDNTAKFYCRVYFADQFHKLRRLIFPAGEDCFVRSLSRCYDWHAKGGKSGCTFCKTHDDRFILKQMTRLEVQSFLNFAPSYIQYITKAYNEQKPTVMAKIVGAYRIVYKNIQTNATSKIDLLVMENLFYEHTISQKFDLKGSVRNRLVNTSGKQGGDIVLLDENLLKMTYERPLYIRPHSKTVLTHAIYSDTQFLAQHFVMDYSLLVGIDDDEKILVVGIIDYIRTFTWDKKLETLVKSTGILGGQGKLPTVVSPEIYRSRFCEAMDSYFLRVPDQWSNLGRGVDC